MVNGRNLMRTNLRHWNAEFLVQPQIREKKSANIREERTRGDLNCRNHSSSGWEVKRNRQNRSIAFFAGRNSLSCFRTTILQNHFSDFGSSLQITPQNASIDPVAFLPSEQQNQRPETKTPPRNPGGVLFFRLTLQG
jgi:hypothetical protein